VLLNDYCWLIFNQN